MTLMKIIDERSVVGVLAKVCASKWTVICRCMLNVSVLANHPPVLSPSDGLAAFRSFLQSEFSDENIEFWVSCEDFKKTKNPVKMATKAKKIYEDFIQSEGPREVRGSTGSKSLSHGSSQRGAGLT